MNWDAIGAISELIGAFAVVVTLVYLAVQIRQNSSAVRSSMRSEIAMGQMQINFALAQDPDLAVATYGFLKGEDLTDRDRLAASQCLAAMFRTFENQLFAYLEGNFPESVWLGYRANIAWSCRQSHFDDFWSDRGPLFSAEFHALVDELASERLSESESVK